MKLFVTNAIRCIKPYSIKSIRRCLLGIYKRRVARTVGEDRIDEIDEYMIFRSGLMDQTGYDTLCNDHPDDIDRIDEIIDIMVEMMLCKNPTQMISGVEYSSGLVKSRIMKLYRSHIEYMLESLEKNTTTLNY